eukprot:TRINITY_DN19995_c0_g1_i1.p1 TRINITY_DN19995_c0_g1~~TRINITY_DN19995_c0_g1_i1.p1  ORF type:complete len:309 (+),score=50.69 TRINITY_DN19995_c0_g1_i1:559-1485(+)
MVGLSVLKEVETLERQLVPLAGKKGGDFSTRQKYLQLVRKHRLRRSELVLRYGLEMLNNGKDRSKLGDDLWNVYEQVGVSALDCGDLDACKACYMELAKRFPGSVRVRRLEGLIFEAKGFWSTADHLYDELMELAPGNQQLYKRKISIVKAQGNLAEAVEMLNTYLFLFMGDMEAWRELADVYTSLQMYKQAAFCYEELVLSDPQNPLFHLGYADLLYTIGGVENYRTAKSYYSVVVELTKGKNVRALYGICLCAGAISSSKGGKQKEIGEAFSLASGVLAKEYKALCPEKASLVASVFRKQADSFSS